MRQLMLDKDDLIIKELAEIGVDKTAYLIFLSKANYKIIKIENLTSTQANILKQTALICGADAAIPKDAYKGARKKMFSAILFANTREIEKIIIRLSEQPWMTPIQENLKNLLTPSSTPTLKIGSKAIEFKRTYIMGVINITPDSFYSGSRCAATKTIEKVAQEIEKKGADFLDIGAESTRPEAQPLSENEEIERLKTVLPTVVKNTKIPISVDTYKANVALFVIDQGVQIINDISGLRFDKKMARVVARNKVNVVIMHIKGKPKTMQENPQYKNLMNEIYDYLKKRIDFALQSGIEKERIIIDPGLGFGKRLENNYEIIERLSELKVFDRPILVGHSRKSFIGKPFNLTPEQRLEGTLGVEALLIKNGASILRVHDVLEAKRVAMLIDKIVR